MEDRSIKSLFICAVWVIAMSACDDNASQMRSALFQDGSLDVIYVDTMTVRAYTVQFDSVLTSDATRFVIGHNENPETGKITSSFFFQAAPEAALTLDAKTTTYSRTVMVLKPDGYSQYDTSQQISISVHELTEDLELRDNGALYNTSSFDYQATAIGLLTFLPKPNTNDSLEIQLSNSFGKNIIALAQQNATEVSGASAYLEVFKGIAIIPDTTRSGPIIGLKNTAEIRVYYWDRTTTPSEEKYLSITGGQYIKFNHVQADRSNTKLENLVTRSESLASDATNNFAYMQGGTGIAMRIEFPYLTDILIENPNLTITDAILEFYPETDRAIKNSSLSDQLILSIANERNTFISTSTTYSAKLLKDEYLDRTTFYQADVQSFVMAHLANREPNRNALLATFNDEQFRHSLTQLKIGNQKTEKKMKLKLYCVVIKN